MATITDQVANQSSDSGDELPVFPSLDQSDNLPVFQPLNQYGPQLPVVATRPFDDEDLPVFSPLSSRGEVLSEPVKRSFYDRIREKVREAASPVIGQTPNQAFRRAVAESQLSPEFRGGATQAQIDQRNFTPEGALQPDRMGAPIVESFSRGVDQLQDTAYGLTQWLATMAGIETPNLDKAAAANRAELAAHPSIIADASQIRGPIDAAIYAAEAIGENLPSSAPSLGAGAIAGSVAKRTAGKLAAEALAKRVASAQAAGSLTANIGQETGSIFSDMVQNGNRDRASAALALAFGVPAGLLDNVGDKLIFSRLSEGVDPLKASKLLAKSPVGSLIREGAAKMGNAVFEQFVAEAPTELFQTVLEQAAGSAASAKETDKFFSNFFANLDTPEQRRDLIESFIKGGVAGGGMGALTSIPSIVRGQNSAAKALAGAIDESPLDPKASAPQVQAPEPVPPAPAAPGTAPEYGSLPGMVDARIDRRRREVAVDGIVPELERSVPRIEGPPAAQPAAPAPKVVIEPVTAPAPAVTAEPLADRLLLQLSQPAPASPAAPAAEAKPEAARPLSGGPPSPVKQVPEPAYFGSVDDVLAFRNTRLAEERKLYANQIGIDEKQSAKLQDLVHRSRSTTKFEKGLTPAQKQKLAEFWDGPWNKIDSGFQAWEIDSRLNPEDLAQETDADVLSSALISAVERGIDSKINNDRFVSALIAGRRMLDLGFTLSNVARQLDRYSTSISSSQSDKAETFQFLGQKVSEFLARVGIELPEGNLAKPQRSPVARISPAAVTPDLAAPTAAAPATTVVPPAVTSAAKEVTPAPLIVTSVAAKKTTNDPEAEKIADSIEAQGEDIDAVSAVLALPEAMQERVGRVVRRRNNAAIKALNSKKSQGNPFSPAARNPVPAPVAAQPAAVAPAPAAAAPVADLPALPPAESEKVLPRKSKKAQANDAKAAKREAKRDDKLAGQDLDPDELVASAFLEANPGMAQALADYIKSDKFQVTLSQFIENLQPSGTDADSFVRKAVSRDLMKFVSEYREKAFEKTETGFKFNTGVGGYKLGRIIKETASAFNRSAGTRNINASNIVNLSEDIEETGQSVESVIAAPEDEPGPDSDELGVRAAIGAKFGNDPTALHALKVMMLRAYSQDQANMTAIPRAVREFIKTRSAEMMTAMSQVTEDIAKKEGVSKSEVRASLMSNYYSIGNGSGISVDAASQAIMDFLGYMPEGVVIVSDNGLVTETGQPLKGVFASDGKSNRITINAANLNGPVDTILTLLHEAIHRVWDDPKIQAITRKLEQLEFGVLGGYNDDTVREELATRAITDRWENQQSRALWRQLVDAIWASVKQFLGFELSDEQMRDVVAAHAIASLANQAVQRAGVVRYNAGLQIFKRRSQVDEQINQPWVTPEQRAGIESVASATSGVIDPALAARWRRMENDVPTPADTPAVRELKKIRVQIGKWMSGFSKVSELSTAPVTIAGVNISHRDLAAAAVIDTAGRVQAFVGQMRRKIATAQKRMDAAAKDFAKIGKHEVAASAARVMSKDIVDAYQDYLDVNARLSPSLSAAQKAAVDAARKTLGALQNSGPHGLPSALVSMASQWPAGSAVSPLIWLRDQIARGWPSFGGTAPMTTVVSDFLAGPTPALNNDPTSMDRIANAIKNTEDAETIRSNITSLFSSWGALSKSSVTPRQFAKLYSEWVDKRRNAVELAERYSNEFKLANRQLQILTGAMEQALEIINNPMFQEQYADATRNQNARAKKLASTGGREIPDRKLPKGIIQDRPLLGDWIIRAPLSDVEYRIKTSVYKDDLDENVKNVAVLIKDIDDWLATKPTNPTEIATYQQIRNELQQVWAANAAIMSSIGHVGNVPFTKDWFMRWPLAFIQNPASGMAMAGEKVFDILSSIFGQVRGSDVVYENIQGPAGQTLIRYMKRRDKTDDVIKAAEDNPYYGSDAMRKKAYKAAVSHGLAENLTHGEALSQYNFQVVNFILSSYQNPARKQVVPGDVTPHGLTITKDDMEVARQQHAFSQSIYDGLRAEAGGVMQFAPMLTETDMLFRRARNYGLTMQRRASRWGMDFMRAWEEAAKREASGPRSWAERLKLLNDADNFTNAVNGMVATTDPTFKLGDKVQQQALRNRYALGGKDYIFDNMDQFLEWMGQERTNIINGAAGATVTDPATERQKAEEFLISDLDRIVQLYGDAKARGVGAESESRIMGVGEAQIDALTGRSSFTQPRRNQLAPDSFYDYTISNDVDRLMFTANAKRYYQKMEMDLLANTISSLQRDLDRMDLDFKDFMKTDPKRRFQKWKFKQQQVADFKAGKLISTQQALSRVVKLLKDTHAGLKQAMERADVEDSTPLRMLGRYESSTMLGKLFQMGVQFTNYLTASFVAPMMFRVAMDRGRFAVLNSLISTAGQAWNGSKALYQAALAAVADNAPMRNALIKYKPLLLGIADHILGQITKRQADLDFLDRTVGKRPSSLVEHLGRWWFQHTALASTSGSVTDRPGSKLEGAWSVAMMAPNLIKELAIWANPNVERFGLRTQLPAIRNILNSIKADVVTAMESRRRAGVPLDAPFHPAELGTHSLSGLNFMRKVFAPAGSIEQLFADFYTRWEAAAPADKASVSLFQDPGMEETVYNHALSFFNMVNDSSKGEGLKGKGWRGAAKSALFRFGSFGIMMTSRLRQLGQKDIRETGRAEIRHVAAAFGMLLALGMLAVVNQSGGQWLRELQSGKVPSTPTITALMDEGTATGFAKAYVLGGANLFMPVFAGYLSSALSGQKGSDPTDLTSLIPGAGSFASFGKMIQQIAQSGDLYYPTTGFLKSNFPVFEALYNRTPQGAAELEQLNAARALRSAAPPGMEVRQPMGGGSKFTATSVDVRDALAAAVKDDKAGFDAAVNRAVERGVEGGMDAESVRKSFLRSVAARTPERSVFGKELTDEERAVVTGRMTGSQLAAFNRMNDIGTRISSWTGTAPRGSRQAKTGSSYLGSGRRRSGMLRSLTRSRGRTRIGRLLGRKRRTAKTKKLRAKLL